MVRRHRAYFTRQIFQPDLCLFQPIRIGVTTGQFIFQFLVIDDAALFHVDQEHLAGLQSPFLDNALFGNVEDTHLGGHYHQVVTGDQITCRAQAISVQRGTDLAAVGKGHGGRAVPRFHHGGMVFIKGAARLIHQWITGPGFRNEQHHGVCHGVTTGHQQFQRIVKTGGVGLTLGNQWPEFLQVVSKQLRGHRLATGVHPVDVAAHGIDLAIVGDHAERMCQVP